MALEDTKVGEYTVPKGCKLCFNVPALHHHPEYYADPETFNPERFLPGNPEHERRP